MAQGFTNQFRTGLDSLTAAGLAAGHKIKVNSGYRSEERQKFLFDRAVKKYGSRKAARKWVAPPGRSQHGKGNAADLGFGNDAARTWAHENAKKHGMNFRMAHEPWHIETDANNLPQNTQQLAGAINPQTQPGASATVPGLFNAIPQATQPQRQQDPYYHASRMEESQEAFLNQQSSMMSQMHKGMGKSGEALEKAHKGGSILGSLFGGRQSRMKLFGGMFGGLFG